MDPGPGRPRREVIGDGEPPPVLPAWLGALLARVRNRVEPIATGFARRLCRRRPGTATGAVLLIVALLLAGVGLFYGYRVVTRAPAGSRTLPTGLPPTPAPGGAGEALLLPHFPPVDVQVSAGIAWVLAGAQPGPGWLMQVDRRTGRVLRVGADRHGTPLGFSVDAGAGSLWVWSQRADSTCVLAQYDTHTLTERRAVPAPGYVFGAVQVDGQLWVSSDRGLFRLPADTGTLVAVPAVTGPFSLAADPGRHRLIVGADAAHRVLAVDTTGHVAASGPASLGKTSLALTGDGRLWLAGFADPDTRTAVQLDPVTLRTIGTTPAAEYPGSIIWPGSHVLWLRSGGSEALACIDPASGRVLQSWPQIQGPVASDGTGPALAAQGDSLVPLLLRGACRG